MRFAPSLCREIMQTEELLMLSKLSITTDRQFTQEGATEHREKVSNVQRHDRQHAAILLVNIA